MRSMIITRSCSVRDIGLGSCQPILPNGAPKELGNPRNIRLDHKHSQPDQGVSTAIPRARRVPSRATDALRTRRNSWRLMRNSASCSEVYKHAPARDGCIRVLLIEKTECCPTQLGERHYFSFLLCVTIASSGGESAFGAASAHNKLPTRPSLSPATRLTPNPTVYWPIAVWSILATSGEGRLSLLPARPKAASSGDTRRSSMMATSAP